jgi:hypothetical protein
MAVEYFDLRPINWPLLEQPVDIQIYRIVAICVVLYLVISLCVHWSSDRVAYLRWFKSNEISKGSLLSDFGKRSGEPPNRALSRRIGYVADQIQRADDARKKLDALEARILDLEAGKRFNGTSEYTDLLNAQAYLRSTANELKRIVSGIDDILDELPHDFTRVDRLVRLQVYLWYFILPVFLGLASSGWTLRNAIHPSTMLGH